MLETAFYLVIKSIAVRSGVIESRYRIADGRFVLDNKDLSRIRFTVDEYISGLAGVEKVSEERAKTLIAENGYKMGTGDMVSNPSGNVETETETQEQEEETNNTEE